MSGGVTSFAGAALRPVLGQAVRLRLGGADRRAAARLCTRLTKEGIACTSGYWNDAADSPEAVFAECMHGLRMLARRTRDGYLSVKFPALGDDDALARDLLHEAGRLGVRVHADSLAPETTDAIHARVEAAATTHEDLGVTLPGRWRRSVTDARWVIEQQLRVRVVKGEWADPEDPALSPRTGYMAVVERLAGHARHVSLATHDVALLARALECLRAAGTACDVEQLYGLPGRACRIAARRAGVPVRVYVPWGRAVLPHAVEFALARKAWLPRWFLRDALAH